MFWQVYHIQPQQFDHWDQDLLLQTTYSCNNAQVHIGNQSHRFLIFIDQTHADAGKAVHVGDDEKADKVGANAVGIDCW